LHCIIQTKTEVEIENAIENNISVKWFSKFFDCLPEALAKKTIRDKDYDFAGLNRELKKISIDQDMLNSSTCHPLRFILR
jgi:hypothetical protein